MIRSGIQRIKSYFRRLRRCLAAFKNRNTPLREFVYLDEVSVYSLIASRLGAVAAEFTSTETSTLQNETGGNVAANVGAFNIGVNERNVSTKSEESQVIRRSIIQSTFRELREYEKNSMPIRSVDHEVAAPDIRSLNALKRLVEDESELNNSKRPRWVLQPDKLSRGTLLEVEVVLETERIFRVSTVVQSFAEIIQDSPEMFPLDKTQTEKIAFLKRIIDRLLVGLVPIRAQVVDYVRLAIDGQELIVHRKLLSRLKAANVLDEFQCEPKPLDLVGVAEHAHFWRDVRRVLFTGARFTVLCRMNQSGIKTQWTPIKLQDVFEAVNPELAVPLRQLASGNLFGKRISATNGGANNTRSSARLALLCYVTSLMNDHEIVPCTNDLVAIEGILGQYEGDLDRATTRREAFNLLADYVKDKYGKNLEPRTEAFRRQDALEGVGLSALAGLDDTPDVHVDGTGEDTAEQGYLLDTELIAIYW